MPPKTATPETLTQKYQQRKSLRQENMASTALNREESLNELEQRVVNLESSLNAQVKKAQSNQKQIGEQELRFDNLEGEVAAIQDQVKRSAEEARETAGITVEILGEEIANCQNNLIGAIRSELTSINEKAREEAHQINQTRNLVMNYPDAARHGRNNNTRWNNSPHSQTPRLEELNRPTHQTFNPDELVDLYFYVNLVGDLGLIRRTLVQDVFNGQEDMVLKYNPHPTLRAGI